MTGIAADLMAAINLANESHAAGIAEGRRQADSELLEALINLVDCTEDTLRSHPETECCTVTKRRCVEARAAIAKTTAAAGSAS